jgi:hypothetical protein
MKIYPLFVSCLTALSVLIFSDVVTGQNMRPVVNSTIDQKSTNGFSTPQCKIREYSQALSIIERTDSLEESCLLLTPGKGSFSYEDIAKIQSLPSSEVCPSLVLTRQNRIGEIDKVRLEIPSRSRMRETSDCCGFDQMKVRLDEIGLHLQLRSKVPTRDCFGGTARTALEEIFLLKDTGVSLEEDKSVEIH